MKQLYYTITWSVLASSTYSSMNKELAGFIFTEILGVILLLGSIEMISNDTGIDINKSNIVVGQVMSRGIIYLRGSRYQKRVFYFRLNNSDQGFTIYHSYQGYKDLESGVNIGDTIKVYYQPTKATYNRTVYQIEKNGIILESYEDYD